MSDLRPASCRSKIPYEQVKAHERAVHVTERDGFLMRTYNCPHCEFWHLTSFKVGGRRVPFIQPTNKEDST